MRSITTFDLQYAHRFYGFQGEAQYLHGHTGVLTIEVEDTVNEGVNMVYPCNEIQKVAWDVLKNFDHALVLREDDPLLPAILDVYEKQGIKNGHPQNKMKGEAFKTPLATAYPDCRLVVTKETMTVEGMIKIVYDLLKEKLNIAKITFTSGVNAGSAEFETKNNIERCPLCGVTLKELPAIKANQRFLPQKKSFCLPLHVSPTAIFPSFSGAIGMILSFRLLLTGCQPVPYARSRNTVTEIFSLHNRDSFHAK